MTKAVQNNPALLDILVLHMPKTLFEREMISTSLNITSPVWEVSLSRYPPLLHLILFLCGQLELLGRLL